MEQTMYIQAIDGVQAARYAGAAAATIYLYDILLTFGLEVEHIWEGLSFNLPTFFYMLNRYVFLPFFLIDIYGPTWFHGAFDDAYCKSAVDYVGFVLAYTGCIGIMTLRVLAIWAQNRGLIRFIQLLWVCVLCGVVVLGYFSYLERRETVYYNSNRHICAVTKSLRIFKITPIVVAVYELFLTALTLIKAFDFVLAPSLATIPKTYRVLTRDGVAYVVISTTATVASIIGWYTLPSTHTEVICSLYWAITSTCLARLVLNLKDANHCVMREQLGTGGVSPGITSAFHTQRSRIVGGGDSFLTGERELGRDPVDATLEAQS